MCGIRCCWPLHWRWGFRLSGDLLPHGGGVEAAAAAWRCEPDTILDLSTGLHPAGPPAWLNMWLREHAALAGRYPDAHGEPARSALADAFAVSPEQVVITAGAQAVIEVIFQAMGWRSVAIRTPCYSEPIRCAERAGCAVRSFVSGAPPAADALWLTTPDNPTGRSDLFPPDFTGVIDESYMPFAERQRLGLQTGVIRVGSLTKSFCIPGLRLGYAIAETELIARLRQWLPPWPASTLALHLLPALLPEADARDRQLVAARRRLHVLLVRYDWQVHPSAASFILARPNGPMPDFASRCILVRHFSEWPQLAGWIRIGLPGSESDWSRLEEALCPQP